MVITNKFFVITHIVLVTAIIYLSVNVSYDIIVSRFTQYPPLQPPQADSTAPLKQEFPPLSYYRRITERNLFKTQNKPTVSDALAAEALSPTDLELKLWGTVIRRGEKSYAVIEDVRARRSKRKQRLLCVDDSVQGATITKILDEKVVLNVDGHNEILKMEEMRSRSRRLRRYRSTASSRRPVHVGVNLRRAQIDRAMQDVTKLMDNIRVRPHPKGIRITRIKPRSIFRRMGLRPGDILTGVDGRRIDSVEDALGLYEGLSSASKVTLELIRRGRRRIIDYRIR